MSRALSAFGLMSIGAAWQFCPECQEKVDRFCNDRCFPKLVGVCDRPMTAMVSYGLCSPIAQCVSPFAAMPSNGTKYEASTCYCTSGGPRDEADALWDVYEKQCGCTKPPPAPCPAPAPPREPTKLVNVFVAGDSYSCFRMPTFVRTKGRLLALAEGRDNCEGGSSTNVVMRSSTDAGLTWGELSVLSSGESPAAVVDGASGDVHVLFSRGGREIFEVTSSTEGTNWSEPLNRTGELLPADIPLSESMIGLGDAVQLTSGRLVVSVHAHLASGNRTFAAFQDPGQRAWTKGSYVGLGDTLETSASKLAALSDGRLAMLMQATPMDANFSGRLASAVSMDGGATWALPARTVASLSYGDCLGGLAPSSQTVTDGIFAAHGLGGCAGRGGFYLEWLDENAASANSRVPSYSVYYGFAGRSSIMVVDALPLVLFEAGDKGPHERISLALYTSVLVHV